MQYQFDQLVHHWVCDTGEVATALGLRRLLAPILALLVAGGFALAPDPHDHVKVKLAKPVNVLAFIHQTDLCLDPEALEIADIGQHHPFKGRTHQQDLKAKRLTACSVDELEVFDDPAGLLQQRSCPAQVGAGPAAAICDRRQIGFAEDVSGHLSAKAFQNCQFLAAGYTA